MPDKDKMLERGEQQSSGVKFSVCALVDLLGFSSHLEISGYDLRTAIGEQAIRRLETLEEGMALICKEAEQLPQVVPKSLRVQRINDAIICTMDLDDFLLPSTGQTRFTGSSAIDLAAHFNLESFDNPDDFLSVYEARLCEAIEPIQQFLGIVARLYLFIQKREGIGFFPGARTIISTGFRRPFRSFHEQDDPLSANFAFANAMVADKSLHGPHLYIDNNLIELCSRDRLARNLMRFSCFEWRDATYDCLRDEQPIEGITWREATKISDPESLMLFRRRYLFRRLNAAPLSFLQHLTFLRPCIEGDEKADRSNPYFAHVLDAVHYGVSAKRVEASRPPKSFLYSKTNDLEASLSEFKELLLTGDSPTRKARGRRKYLENMGHPELMENEDFMAEMDELDAKTVTIKMKPIPLGDLGDFVWGLSEEEFAILLPLMADDFSGLEFPQD